MILICVICAVIGFISYTGIKIKVNEWLNESRMSKISLKKNRAKNEKSHSKNTLPNDLNNVIEITDDESDLAHGDGISEDDVEPITASSSNKNYDKETLYKFQKSTDSGETEDDEQKPIFQSMPKPRAKTSMFDWNSKTSHQNKNNKATTSNSYSSDESDFCETKWCETKRAKKKLKNEKPEPKEDVQPEVAIHYEQVISGIKVKFPVKPYSCQVAVMNKVIQGCVKSENCLLESPTGTGKTLALLCSVLSWHDHHSAQMMKERLESKARESNDYWVSDEDFIEFGGVFMDEGIEPKEEYVEKKVEEQTKYRIPKIYYGTRTHKQIQQVIKELKKTAYKHKKVTILSSREHTCIQETDKNKTELCNDLLDPMKGKRCPFYNESNKKAITTFGSLAYRGVSSVWDIEELVAVGKENGICPYFAARNLMEHADIVFCPYNYIIDPDIRESMQINLKDEVVILDEAHNIEDICRDVASVSFREDHLSAIATECESLAKQRDDDLTYNTIKLYILKLVKFIKAISLDIVDTVNDTLSSPYWTGAELLELFNMHNLGESTYKNFQVSCNAAMADVNNMKEESRILQRNLKPIISSSTQTTLGHLVFSMRMITSPEYVNDFRACVVENTVKDFKYLVEDTWQTFKKREHRARTLKLICMNPGVIFQPLSRSARCVILASGTLTPIGSYQSELNTAFSHILNAGHVIPKEQVYATCISKGPNGIQLRANYQTVSSWSFQDELGLVLLHISESVPHGVLCFFSSYNVLNKQTERWKHTSTWNKISSVKRIFVEPRYASELESIMNEYREVIEDTSAGPVGTINGGLFLAVYRGKVAEGIDFKDDEARCVVCVGIPFPVRKDPVIAMKFKYNDTNTSKGLLRGSEWYSIQAFRALNQALGRCLRHINDWGAVILVDERFLLPEYRVNLPKWVKAMWVNQTKCNFTDELRAFVKKRKGELS